MSPDQNPMEHPEEPASGSADSPRFGLLLIVLAIAVIMIGVLTFSAEAYFSP